MDFYKLINQRYSVRSYKTKPVEESKLKRILEAARLAPTANNLQPFKVIVITSEDNKDVLKKIYNKDWFAQAPVIICTCGIPEKSWVRKDGKNYNDVDVAIVMDYITLAATEEGLGTCWIAAFDEEAAIDVLDLPEEMVPIAFTPLGYAENSPPPKKRKDISELVIYKKL